ncbi:unnamed protein product, partial [Prorocentrum cordatum]
EFSLPEGNHKGDYDACMKCGARWERAPHFGNAVKVEPGSTAVKMEFPVEVEVPACPVHGAPMERAHDRYEKKHVHLCTVQACEETKEITLEGFDKMNVSLYFGRLDDNDETDVVIIVAPVNVNSFANGDLFGDQIGSGYMGRFADRVDYITEDREDDASDSVDIFRVRSGAITSVLSDDDGHAVIPKGLLPRGLESYPGMALTSRRSTADLVPRNTVSDMGSNLEVIDQEQPLIIIHSPPCKVRSRIRDLSNYKRDQGLADADGIGWINADMREFNLRVDGGKLNRKPTSILSNSIEVKLPAYIDQADDTEIEPMDTNRLRGLIQARKTNHNDGGDPAEEEEATGEQLAALAFRVQSGATPCVDMGIWRPRGARVARAFKFNAHAPQPGGGFQQRECSGPASLQELAAFLAGLLLGEASGARLDRHKEKVSPRCWFIAALADMHMRSEHLERIPRGPGHGEDENFRGKEFDEEALWHATHAQSLASATDDGTGPLREVARGSKRAAQREEAAGGPTQGRSKRGGGAELTPRAVGPAAGAGGGGRPPWQNWGGGRGGGGKGGGEGAGGGVTGAGKGAEARASNGQYFWTTEGAQICWDWNWAPSGRSEPCPMRRAH